MENKTCKQCSKKFVVADDEFAFYKKMSPTFDGKTFEIPAPTLCPDCRRQKRCAWRNMSKLYRRKCDFSEEELVSPFAPNSRHKVYKNEIWWSDKWNPLDCGRDFDFSRSFFEQLQELNLEVPKMHSFVNANDNSDFVNCASETKNSYMVQNATNVDNCYHCVCITNDKDCVDCHRTTNSEKCYECVLVDRSFDCHFSVESDNCSESYFLDNCVGCKNCFACANLKQKQYWIYNKEATKEEFKKTKNEFLSLTGQERENKIKEIRKFLNDFPKRSSHIIGSEESTGDQIYYSKNAKESFYIANCEDVKYCFNIEQSKSSYDHDFWGNGSQNVLDSDEVGDGANNVIFSQHSWGATNIYYSIEVLTGSHDCFGCVGLTHAEYSVFNKKYSKDEYEKLVAKIVEHMQKTGEWGEYFPLSMSMFGYNESTAQDYFPLTREQAKEAGANWQTEDFTPKYEGQIYEPKNIRDYNLKYNPEAEKNVSEALAGILKCEVTGKPYKLQSKELAFYIENDLQIPRRHPEQRNLDRFHQTNPLKLFHRQCMCEESEHGHAERCPNEFETTYAPDRPERVHCESCYQKSVI